MFNNPERDLRVSVHGDDFTVLGYIDDLNWFQMEIKAKFETKVRGIIGPEDTDDRSIKILNRIVQWTPDGIEYEVDQRHAEIIQFNSKRPEVLTASTRKNTVRESISEIRHVCG